MNKNKLNGLILAGGQSRRMGRDKALIAYHGVPQYVYLAGLLESLGVPAYLSAREEQIEKWKPTIPCIPDLYENKGPLGGILSAHLARPDGAWLVVACDYAFLSERSIKQLLDARNTTFDLTSFFSPFDQKPEPLLAIWEIQAFAGLNGALEKEQLSLRKYMIQQKLKLLRPEWPEELQNVNEP